MPPAPDIDWDLVEDLVFECLELTADDADGSGPRVAELLAKQDPGVAEEVRRMLVEMTDWQTPAPSPTSPAKLNIPDTLGPYRIAERLGQGGMGAVYVGHDESLDRRVAVKVVRPELLAFDGARERFRREVEAVARLSHPGIVPVYQVGEDDGVPWFAMELVAGGSLADLLARFRQRDPAELRGEDLRSLLGTDSGSSVSGQLQGNWQQVCLRLAREIADALAHAHSRGVLHRDIKPSNIVLDQTGHARVLDFGLARAEGGGDLTASGAVLGSMPYLPPEHLRGNAGADDVRTDVYSLGVTLFEMLSLRSPFLGENEAATMRLVEQGNPPPLRQLHRGLTWEVATVVGVAIDRDPQRRYQSMLDFSADLQRVLDRRPIAARPPSSWLRMRRSVERNPITTTGIVAAVLATIALVLVYTLGLQAERDAAIRARRETQQLREVDRVRGYRASVAAAHMAIQLGQSEAAHDQLLACPEELREYEWRHLMARLNQDLEAIEVSPKFLRGVVQTQRGMITAGADGQVHLVAPTPDRTVTTFQSEGLPLIMAVAASPDGRHVLTGHMDHTVGLWDGEGQRLRTGISLDDLYGERKIGPLQQRCFAVAISKDGTTGYAVGCGGAVAVIDLASGSIQSSFLLPPVRGAVFSVAINDAGDLLAVGHGHDVLLVRPTSGEIVHRLRGHFGYVHALRFTGRDNLLLSSSQDRTVRAWNVASGQAGQVLFGHNGAVFDLTPGTNATVWTASGDATLRQWDIQTGRELRRLGADTALYAIARKGDQLVTAGWDGHLRTWNAVEDRAQRNVDGNQPTQLATLLVHDENSRLTVVDVGTGVRTFSLPDGKPVPPLVGGKPDAVAARGDVIAAVHGETHVEVGDRVLTGAEVPLQRLCILADGTVVAAESGGHVLLWSPTAVEGRRVAAHSKPLWVLEPFRDGFISAAEDGTVLWWRNGNPEELLRRDVEWQGAQASHDERTLYLAGLGKLLAVEVDTGTIEWERDVAERMRDVAVSASGNRLLVIGADRFLHIIDATDGYEVVGLPTTDPMRCIANVADVTVTVSVYSSVDIWFGR